MQQSAVTSPSPLQGVRVLDFSSLEMGPVAAMWLGDLGADVVKIERIDGGDPVRKQKLLMNGQFTAPLLGEDSATFMSFNRNKRSMALDLKHPRAKDIVFRLVRTADVVLSNFRPGVMESLGFGYEDLQRINPRVIYCTASGYGYTGPYRYKKGQDLIAQAMSGLMSMTGDRDGPPTATGVYLVDYVGGVLAALGIMAALLARAQTGKGQHVDASLLDAAIATAPAEGTAYMNTEVDWVRGKGGSGHGPGAPTYGVYKTKDGYVAVGGPLRVLCEVLGLENLELDERYNTLAKQSQRQKELRQMLEKVFVTRGTEEWVRRFDEKDIFAGPVRTYREVFADPQVLHNGMVLEVDHPRAGKFKMVGVPLRLSATPPRVRRPPPLLGQHTDEILREIGYTEKETEELRRLGVIR